ncbi:MAG: hypothetical protein WCJ57_01225 [Candidatus Falkowbacteria bacterium]
MTDFQKEKLKILLFYQVPEEIISFLFILIPIALFYVVFYLINGDLKQITEIDLPALTVCFPESWVDISYDDFGLKYSLSGWWNILFLSIWFNLMRYLRKIIYFKFPYSRIEYSGYSLLILLTAAMVYFSYVGGSPLYGLAYNIILLIAYTLAHLLICFLLWFLGAERV